MQPQNPTIFSAETPAARQQQMEEEFYTVKPSNALVAQYVDYYYVHRCENVEFEKQYKFYPHLKHAVSMYQGATVQLDGNSSKVVGTGEMGCSAIYTQVMTAPFEVQMTGRINKIAIAFKPLGLLYFLPTSLDQVSTEIISPFNPYGEVFDQFMGKLFEEQADIVQLLDGFLEEQYRPFEQLQVIEAVGNLMNTENTQTIQEICAKMNLNRKTLLRKFRKYLCCSPEEFRKVARFRHSLTQKLKHDQDASLTRIALENNYYDQSDFVRNYRKITGESPTGFLKKGTLLGDEDTFWTLLDDASE
jgi:AraC-like DNA-binding protein